MGADHHLKVRSKQLTGKLYTDGVGLLRRYLAGCEGLYEVIAQYTVRLAKGPLGFQHFLICGRCTSTIHCSDKKALLCLLGIHRI